MELGICIFDERKHTGWQLIFGAFEFRLSAATARCSQEDPRPEGNRDLSSGIDWLVMICVSFICNQVVKNGGLCSVGG